jgi:hypothetical protein
VSNNKIHNGEAMDEEKASEENTDDIDGIRKEMSQDVNPTPTEDHQEFDLAANAENQPIKVGKMEELSEALEDVLDNPFQPTDEKEDQVYMDISAHDLCKNASCKNLDAEKDKSGGHKSTDSNVDCSPSIICMSVHHTLYVQSIQSFTMSVENYSIQLIESKQTTSRH